MTRSFIQLWTRSEFEAWQKTERPLLRHAASNQFSYRGVKPGDRVFIVSCFSGKVWLLGALSVKKGPLAWEEIRVLGLVGAGNVSGLKDHLLADDHVASLMRFDLTVSMEMVRAMRFGNGESPRIRGRGGIAEVDPQTFRGVREITADTAALLLQLLSVASQESPLLKIRALSIRQPYAERILRREKKVEYRSWPTRYRGKVYIYAAKSPVNLPGHHDPLDPLKLPRGVIVGTMEIVDCVRGEKYFEWLLADVVRFATPLQTREMPQAGYFFPFGRGE